MDIIFMILFLVLCLSGVIYWIWIGPEGRKEDQQLWCKGTGKSMKVENCRCEKHYLKTGKRGE